MGNKQQPSCAAGDAADAWSEVDLLGGYSNRKTDNMRFFKPHQTFASHHKPPTMPSSSKKALKPRPRKFITLYDALASRVTAHGRQQQSRQVAADEYIAVRARARGVYENEGIPFPKEGEKEKTLLPDGNLLLAIHEYASEYYARHSMSELSFRSLDETALLALGILLEESVDTMLGTQGERAFVQQEEPERVDRDFGPMRNEFYGDTSRVEYPMEARKRKREKEKETMGRVQELRLVREGLKKAPQTEENGDADGDVVMG